MADVLARLQPVQCLIVNPNPLSSFAQRKPLIVTPRPDYLREIHGKQVTKIPFHLQRKLLTNKNSRIIVASRTSEVLEMLKIVPASAPLPIENIVLTIYAAPGLGKSSLSFTAEKPLMLDFDRGSYRAATRGDAVSVTSWSDVSQMTAEDLAAYHTIVVDTAGRALDALAADIIAGNPKAGRGDGSLTLQGFGTLKSRFAQWQAFLRSLKKDLVLVCHMDEQKNGDDTMERIDAQGASRNEIYKSSDAMCRIRLDSKDQRFLDFDPRQGGFGKNPAQLPKIAFPDPRQNPRVLADVIDQIKSAVNRMTEQQADARKEQEEWIKAMAECATLDCFNERMVPLAKERKGAFGRFVKAEAKRRGYAFDKDLGIYMQPVVEAVA